MGVWRGLLLLCSVLAGCGGAETPAPDGSGQGNEAPSDTPPTSDPGDRTGTPTAPSEPTTPGEPTTPDAPSTPPTSPRAQLGAPYLVKDIFPPADGSTPPWLGPSPSALVAFRGRLLFAAAFEGGAGGLWTSDGTEVGTVQLKGFPADTESPQTRVRELTPVGSQLFFSGGDTAQGQELWVSDGTSAGTRLVKDITPGPGDTTPHELHVLGGRLLFFRSVVSDGAPGRTELWTSDGSDAGTQRVKDLGPDSYMSGTPKVVGGALYFTLEDPTSGAELWRTDGTEAGTRRVKDIESGTGSAYPRAFQAVGGTLFFLTAAPSHGPELWRTDGTETGTRLVRSLPPDSDTSIATLLPGTGQNVFLALSGADHRMRLSSLTVSGSGDVQERAVATLTNAYAGQEDADPSVTTSVVAGDQLFFGQAISSSGPAPRDVQLWVTDGTEAGTRQVSRPLSLSDEFQTELYALDDRVLYSNITSGQGLEPWVTDGTQAGTAPIADLEPGAGGSFPSNFTRVGSTVYFVAHTQAHGSEIWGLPLEE